MLSVEAYDVEQSLRRLQTDHLDLVQVHLSPPRSEMEASGTIEALESLRAESDLTQPCLAAGGPASTTARTQGQGAKVTSARTKAA